MKITSIQYAKILYDLTKDKNRSEIDKAIIGLAKILIKKKDTKLVLKITRKFEEIWNKENEIVETEIVSKEKIEGDLMDKLERFIKEKYKAKEVVFHSQVDKKIKGGFILKVGDEVIDASLAKNLQELKNKLIL